MLYIYFLWALANGCTQHDHLPSAIPSKPCDDTIRGHEDLSLLDWGRSNYIDHLSVAVLTEACCDEIRL